jgi:signal transduction histidine kinase
MLINSPPPCDGSPRADGVLSRKTTALRGRDARLRAMKALVGELAHSFNNSLAPLAGYATLLGEDLKPGTSSELYMSKLQASLRKTEGFIEGILAATHPERHFSPKPVDLTSLLQRSTDEWMKSLPVSAKFSIERSVVPCSLWLDETQWSSAIGHLLRNAQLALARGGVVRLTLEERELTGEQASELDLAKTHVFQLRVNDTGCGMAPEVLERACEPLYTTRAQGPLAGLGLTLVHSVVQLQGGQLEIESAEQAGTTVCLWLPA